MSFHFVNNNVSHTIEKVVFNGTEVEKVRFNGQLVFVKYIPVSINDYEPQSGEYNECEIVIDNYNPYSVDVNFDVLDIDNAIMDTVNVSVEPNASVSATIFNTSNNEELTLSGNVEYNDNGKYVEIEKINQTIYVSNSETSTAETVTPDTNTQTMSLTKTKAVSSEGNFTLYQGGENK